MKLKKMLVRQPFYWNQTRPLTEKSGDLNCFDKDNLSNDRSKANDILERNCGWANDTELPALAVNNQWTWSPAYKPDVEIPVYLRSVTIGMAYDYDR